MYTSFVFFNRKMSFMTGSKGFVPYFCKHHKIYTISLSFKKIDVFLIFKIVLNPC